MTLTTREYPRTAQRLGLIAVTAAITLLVWFAAALVGVDVAVIMNGAVRSVSGASVAVAAIAAGLGAWAVRALLSRMLRNSRRAWLVISIAFALISLVGPLTMATSATASGVLVMLHLVPAVILISALATDSTEATEGTDTASTGYGYGGTP